MAYFPRARVTLRVLLEDFDGGGGTKLHHYDVVPREVSVDRNTHREADTFDLELDYSDFPLDPRTVRSCQVQVWMGDVGDPAVDLPLERSEYLAFVGYVDEPETSLSDAGEKLTFSGRDYTCLFLDHRWDGGSIDVTRPLAQVVAYICENTPGAEQIAVEFRGGSEAAVLADRVGKTKFAPEDKDDAWTVLVELCGLAGLVPVVELDTLVIKTPNEVQQRSVELGYGRDVASLRYRRKLNSARRAQVRVRCWNPQTREALEVTYPREPIVIAQKVSTAGKVSTETAPIVPWSIEGTFTADEIEAIARKIYEEMARSEVEGEVETREMLDRHGTPLWLLANGDQLRITLGKADLSSIQGMSSTEAIAYLQGIGIDAGPAAALVDAFHQAEDLAARFYVMEASHRWSRDDGYRLSVKFANYVGGAP